MRIRDLSIVGQLVDYFNASKDFSGRFKHAELAQLELEPVHQMILEAVSPQIGQQLLKLRESDNEVLALHQIVENGQICFFVDVIEEIRLHDVVGIGPYQLLPLSL